MFSNIYFHWNGNIVEEVSGATIKGEKKLRDKGKEEGVVAVKFVCSHNRMYVSISIKKILFFCFWGGVNQITKLFTFDFPFFARTKNLRKQSVKLNKW